MLIDRGYIVDEKALEQSKNDFIGDYFGKTRDSLNMVVSKKVPEGSDEEGDKLIVYFPDKEKVNREDLQEIATKMVNIRCFNSILVLKGHTSIAKKVKYYL